ncbi:hypothetical protein Q4E93_24275 [Flavitalea sp. BT771]|uniref:hypothetical protein n=1 Tax=Flavitalea sp. BT771 TaxID=3063329 RepID=UPI0026E21D75|nr:hypothetical protein [Flavitalea sp. BT771]MDO6433744.1 hypothetical protein [Flavitalea sp. BT771]MDV6222351.1 hypothetical protein [Flavitalea sp. BT771]
MYAIDHAATALLVKKKFPASPMFPLLVSVQLVELFWVLFNYTGLEYFSVANGRLHLDFLPWSHSICSALVLAALSYIILYRSYKKHDIALAFAIGVLSHVAIDLVFHEHDIRLTPFTEKPAWGLGIIDHPLLDFTVELLYGICCWWYFKGSKKLLITIVIFNVLDLPIMLASGDSLNPIDRHHYLLPSFILFQILVTWYFIWQFSAAAHVHQHRKHPPK